MFNHQLLFAILLQEVFCSAAATDDASPPVRKRTQLRHSSGSKRDNADRSNFDPFIGVPRELTADDMAMSTATVQSMSINAVMSLVLTTSVPTSLMSSVPTPTPTMDLLPEYEPCDDPNQVPLEVNIITDQFADVDKTGYSLTSHPDDGPELITYLERMEMSNSATYSDPICVPRGRYNFTVYDKLNGLCCSGGRGEFSVKSKGTEILYGGGFPAPSISYTILAGEPDMSDEEKQWLNGHNTRRKKFHTDHGKTFKPLVWSESLAETAARYASTLTTNCAIVQKLDGWGHNVAINSSKNVNQTQILPETVIRYMFDRKIAATYPDNNQLTQIAWRGSRYVGCASLIEQSKSGAYCHVSVCKYGRPGNCAVTQDNWLEKTLADRSNCGRVCPDDGCQ